MHTCASTTTIHNPDITNHTRIHTYKQVEAVVAIDLKYYIMLRRYAELARATYLTAFDMLEKNMEVGGQEAK